MRVTYVRMVLAAACVAAAVSPLGASVIFTDLKSPSASSFLFDVVAGSGFGPQQSLAAAFAPTTNSTMNEAQVSVYIFFALGQGDFNLYLYSNSGGAPGSSLETLGTDLIAPKSKLSLVADSSFAPIALTGGTQYWLVMTPVDSNSSVEWVAHGVPAVQSDSSFTSNGSSPWTSAGNQGLQFEIDGTTSSSVPEPGTAGLVTAGLGLAVLINRRKTA